MNSATGLTAGADSLDIIAFRVHDQEFCVETRLVREIRGWSPCTPVPHAPRAVAGVISLRGSVIPILDLAVRLGMEPHRQGSRSAIVVVEFLGSVVGLIVDRVSDILTVQRETVQPLMDSVTQTDAGLTEGMISSDSGLMCLIDVERLLRFDIASGQEASRAA